MLVSHLTACLLPSAELAPGSEASIPVHFQVLPIQLLSVQVGLALCSLLARQELYEGEATLLLRQVLVRSHLEQQQRAELLAQTLQHLLAGEEGEVADVESRAQLQPGLVLLKSEA